MTRAELMSFRPAALSGKARIGVKQLLIAQERQPHYAANPSAIARGRKEAQLVRVPYLLPAIEGVEHLFVVCRELVLFGHKIALMLNVNEDDHRRLEAVIRRMLASLDGGKATSGDFPEAFETTRSLTRQILKSEWNQVKIDIPIAK